jgi:type IV secretion system protein VirB10
MNMNPGDRDNTAVAGNSRFLRTPKQRKAALAVGGVGIVCLLGLGVRSGINDKGPASKPDDLGTGVIAQVAATPPLPAPPAAGNAPAPPVVAATPQQGPAIAAVNGGSFVRMPTQSGELFFSQPRQVAPAPSPAADAGKPDDPDTGQTRVAFKPSTIDGAKAGPAIQLTYVMTPQLIPCALETAMDSTVAGAISCHTTQPVLSPSHVLLMPAGTQIMGTYKNDTRRGQSRLFAFVGSAITPEGIPVPLNSEVADGLGRAGIQGDVDNHYAERFGAGILLSGSESALALAQAMVSKGGNQYFQINSGGGVSDIATEVLRSQIDIAPTITVPPGKIISIVVDHPIDFSDAIKVKAINR